MSIDRFKSFKWLTGWMTYASLILSDILSESRMIYLDSDLIVLRDLSELWDQDLVGSHLGAVSRQRRVESNDSKFFQAFGG